MDINVYNNLLKNQGKDLSEIGINEIALSKKTALFAIDILKELNIPILGGDVYLLNNVSGKISNTYDSWHCDREKYSGESEYYSDSWYLAKEYIQKYKESNGTALFTLVIRKDSF